jgi:LysR family glycine cleavage system transcriptional activator
MQHRLPLNNLNTFASAAEHLSFQEAAESLFVTPSAVSHQIRNLEKLLGYKLFDRLDKHIRLTAQGERLFKDVRNPIRELHKASRKAFRGLEDNVLTLSVVPVFATGWLIPRLKNFHAAYPDINLSVIATVDLINFNSDPFDASIRMGIGDWANTVSYRLFNREIVAVCHPDLLNENEKIFTPQQLNQYPLIRNSSMPGLWQEWFQSLGINAPLNGIKLQVDNSAQVVEALQSGESVGLIDRRFIGNDIQSGRLAIACDHLLVGDDGYYLLAPDSAQTLPSFQCFKDWLYVQLEINEKE